jgi:hypothetical protein
VLYLLIYLGINYVYTSYKFIDKIMASSSSSLARPPYVDPGLPQKLLPVFLFHCYVPPILHSQSLNFLDHIISHLSLGLPIFLIPVDLMLNTFLTVHTYNMSCPAQSVYFNNLTRSGSLNNSYTSRFYLFLHTPFSCTTPKMHLSFLLSNTLNDLSSVFDSVQVSDAYVSTGLMSRPTLYISVSM